MTAASRRDRAAAIFRAVHHRFLYMPHTIHAKEAGLLTAIPLKTREEMAGGRPTIFESSKKYSKIMGGFDRRADFLSWTSRPTGNELSIVEVKSCIADFRSDDKWQRYLPYCNKFYFAVDENFPIEEIKTKVGRAGILLVKSRRWIEVVKRPKVFPLGEGVDRNRLIFIIARRLYYTLYQPNIGVKK